MKYARINKNKAISKLPIVLLRLTDDEMRAEH